MDFTEIYKQTLSLVSFSPGTHFLLTAVQDRLIIRRSDSFQIARTWLVHSTPSPTSAALSNATSTGPLSLRDRSGESGSNAWITHAGWSCDSEYVLGACAKTGIVSVFKLRDETWSARIEAGSEGLVKAEWAPDGRTVLCFSEWGLRVTMWSLVTGAATYIQYPIHPDRGYAFRQDSRYFVLAERHKSKDTLGVYDAHEAYRLVRHFPLPTGSISSLSLSPTGNYLAVWEGPLEYKLYIITLAGNVVATFSPEPDPGFGIRFVSWHPSGLFLAVAGSDDRVHILETLTWNPIATLDLPTRIPNGVHIWREPSGWLEATHGRGFLSYERIQAPSALPTTASQVRTRPTKPPGRSTSARPGFASSSSSGPTSGTTQLAFNTSGTLLLVRSAASPTAVVLYDFPHSLSSQSRQPSSSTSAGVPNSSTAHIGVPQLRTVLLHTQPVTTARWNPDPSRAGRLAVACGTQSVYLWSDEWVAEPEPDPAANRRRAGEPNPGVDVDTEVAECVGVPAQKFETRDLRWAPDGKGMVLLDRETFCCAFEVEEEGQESGTI
ncbi:WD repeat-containing protein 8 [Ganoderma leucocontextum]|nr:WD repeat-containing protein 8 [Ganoderma leucocontextum]